MDLRVLYVWGEGSQRDRLGWNGNMMPDDDMFLTREMDFVHLVLSYVGECVM